MSTRAVSPGALGTRRWRLWLLLGEAVVVASAIAIHYWPILSIANVTYEGPADWEAEVRSLVMLPSDGNILHFMPADAESNIETRFGDRADAQVRVDLPNRVSIRLTPLTPCLWTDDRIGVAVDGSLLPDPALRPERPTWRPGIDWEGSRPLANRSREAAGAWSELSRADRRFELTTSEWTRDPERGWTVKAFDGRSQIAFGHTNILERAQAVARLLDQNDTLLAEPYLLDARFEGQLVLTPHREDSVEGEAPAEPALESPTEEQARQEPRPPQHNRHAQDALPVKVTKAKGRA